MKFDRLVRSCLAAILIAPVATPVHAGDEIQLIIESPQPRSFYFPEFASVQYRSGWELSVLLRARERQLLGVAIPIFGEPVAMFPEAGLLSALIFVDGDDCLSLGGDSETLAPDFGPCPADPGERYVLFYPDTDHTGVDDTAGLADLQGELADQSNWPEFGGPDLTEGAVTGIGYGTDDDLPSLVLISNVGVGIVFDPLDLEGCVTDGQGQDICQVDGWDRAVPAARHNLAGLMDRVGFELRTQWGYSEITASLQVPRHLFSPLVIADDCYQGQGSCDGMLPYDGANRIDAGSINAPAVATEVAQVQLRAVVVNGRAPSIITDTCVPLDGEVTAADLECMGYTLLSNEAIVEFEHRGQELADCSIDDPWTAEIEGACSLFLLDVFNGGNVQGGSLALGDFDGDAAAPRVTTTKAKRP